MRQHLNKFEIHRFTDIQIYIQPYVESRIVRIVTRINRIVTRVVRIITRIVRITKIVARLVRKWNYPNRKWKYFSNFKDSDQKTHFIKGFTFDPRD